MPPHLSKDQDIEIGAGDVVRVSTPGGGGFGDPAKREPAAIARDVARGYYSEAEAREKFGAASRGMKLARRAFIALPLADRRPASGRRRSSHPSGTPSAAPTIAFIVDMPGEPVYKVIDTRSPGGTAFAYHSYSLEYRRLSFVAQTALYPADVDVRQAATQPAVRARRPRAAARRRQVDQRRLARRAGRAGRRIGRARSQGGSVLRQLVLLKGRRYVSLAYLAPADALRTPEADRFFKSLRLGA